MLQLFRDKKDYIIMRNSLTCFWVAFFLIFIFNNHVTFAFRSSNNKHYANQNENRNESNKKKSTLNNIRETFSNAKRQLVAAAVARAVSIFAMYPVDTIKTRIQMFGTSKNALNVRGIYKGVGGSLFGQVPYGVLTFGSYELYKQYFTANYLYLQQRPVFLYALAAILGDVTGSVWLCPSEVVKQQLQGGMHTNTLRAVSDIWKKQGFLGFYQGYAGGLARDVPFRVAQLTSYEITKNQYLKIKRKRESNLSSKTNIELSAIDATICGAIAGTFSSAITTPLDRIKTLLMTNNAAYGNNVISCACNIWKKEGLQGFCTGIVPRVVYIAPSVMLFFSVYEQVQQRLAD